MAEVTTKSGFKVKIADDAMDNWDILTYFREIDKGNVGAIVDVAPILLGEKQMDSLKKHVKTKNGVVKASDMVAEINEILTELKTTKKS